MDLFFHVKVFGFVYGFLYKMFFQDTILLFPKVNQLRGKFKIVKNGESLVSGKSIKPTEIK